MTTVDAPAPFEIPETAADADLAAWRAAGLAALTGHAGAPGIGPPRRLVPALRRLAASIEMHSAASGHRVVLDPLETSAARAAAFGLTRQGSTSCGGASRLVATQDDWLVVTLARLDDRELVPAWLAPHGSTSNAADDPWAAIERAGASSDAATLRDAAVTLGLPVARLGERGPTERSTANPSGFGGVQAQRVGAAPPVTSLAALRVVDLSSLWAGPLLGSILAAAGAQVTKVESSRRPDGARSGPRAFFDRLNARKRGVRLDFASTDGITRLRTMLEQADVVIEASRPRALAQLGIDSSRIMSAPNGPRIWVSITGYGRAPDQAHRVAFGDDAAAAGGLVRWTEAGPVFCADAIADPLTGMTAAAATFERLAAGGRWHLDVAMADAAASVADDRPAFRRRDPTAPRRRAAPTGLLLDDVEVHGVRTSVLVDEGRIATVGSSFDRDAVREVIPGRGGALLPGLHDHHVHLAATAALSRSIEVGPPAVRTEADLQRALADAARTTPRTSWIRAVGYTSAVAGDLDRDQLDRLLPGRLLRVQDRSGARWTVGSLGVAALHLDAVHHPGVERDAVGRPTGRLHRLDAWLRDRLPEADPLPFAALGRRLAACGVTGVTDATPSGAVGDLALLAEASSTGALPQRITAMGGVDLVAVPFPAPLQTGPVKVVIDDLAYPALESLVDDIRTAHRHRRSVAIHAVTRTALALALAAFDGVGTRSGDRIEHGSVIAPDHLPLLRAHGLTVVTQPAFVASRGDAYVRDVDPDDLAHLYPCGSLLAAGIRVAAGTDAPHADIDPWRTMAAAIARTTPSGRRLVPAEAIDPESALALLTGRAEDPGGPPRAVVPGARADLCLLQAPWAVVRSRPASEFVRLTLVGGRSIYDAEAG